MQMQPNNLIRQLRAAVLVCLCLWLGLSFALAQQTGTTRYVYDNNGRLRAVLAPNGEAALYDYDPAGNVTAIRRLAATACETLEFTPQQGTSGALVTIYGVGLGGQVRGVSFNGVVAQIVGHKPSATAEKHYKVRPLELLRLHHEKIEAWVLEQAGVSFDAKAKVGGLPVVAA